MSQSTYQLIDLTANLPLLWPASFGSGTYVQDINDVNASAGPFSIIMPAATSATKGFYALFNNVSANSFNIMANDGITLITSIAAGKLIEVYLYDNSTANGLWRTPSFASGTNAIVNLTAASADNSIVITNGAITPPGGTIDFALTESLYNFNKIAAVGFPAVVKTGPLEFGMVTMAGSDNITITNADGVLGNTAFALNSDLIDLTSITVGDMFLTGTTIAPNIADTDLVIASTGTGNLSLNGVLIDTGGNLTINGTFNNVLIPKVSVIFSDTFVGTSNYITIIDKSNNALTVTWLSPGNYKIIFGVTLPTNNYGVQITTGTDGGTLPFVTRGAYITSTMTTTECTIEITDLSGVPVISLPYGATVQIIQS